MKKFVLFLFILFCLNTVKAQLFNPAYQDGKVYAKFNKSTIKQILNENPRNISINKLNELEPFISKYGISKVLRPFYQANDDDDLPYVLRIEFSKINLINGLIEDLQKLSSIVYVEKVPLAKIDAIPNDPLFLTAGGGNHLNQINAQIAWNISTGNPTITVAIIDNAVMWTHADLVANTYTNTGEIANNGIDDDNNGYIDDRNGFDVADYDNNAIPTNTNMSHGTHCAGIAAASTNNGIGVSGIGWNIKFIPVKCETNNGSTSNVPYGFEGIIYAAKAKAKIISLSWTNFSNVASITEQSVINYAWNRGCIVIACAGNFSSNTPYYPGAYNNVYCVAAVTNSPADIIAPYSNYGTWVDIAAPGTTINSTVPYLGSPQYLQLSGTSMATPLVAGLAGLIMSYAPNMTRTNVLNCISSSAANIYTLSGNSAYVSGNLLGAGRIDAYAALLCAANYTAIAPQANFYAFPKNACPNTPVNFYDSSNYVPSNWNWTFQGGTPSTSTLSNPIVQWSAPGTYSVALTVNNASGSNTISKLAYVNITNPSISNLPFNEGFEANAFLPNGWTANNIQNDEMFWQRKTGIGAFGTSSACAMFDNSTYIVSGDKDEMRTPKFDFTNVVKAKLKFDVAYARYDATFSDTLEVKLSTDCGVNWTSIYLNGGTNLATSPDLSSGVFVPTNTQWRKDSINISALTSGQNNVMFSFINHGHFGQPIYIDNINLFFPSPQLSVNFYSVTCVSNPRQFYNTSAGGGLNYNWTFQGGTPSVSTIPNPIVTYNSVGLYTVSLSAINGPVQGILVQTLSVISASNIVTSYTSLNVTCASCNDGSILLNTIGGSGNYTYSWTPNVSTGASAYSLSPGNYTIDIKDQSGCLTTLTVNVDFYSVIEKNNIQEGDFSFYPNPAEKELFIQFPNTIFDMKLINALGEIITDQRNIKETLNMSIAQYSKGIYFIEIDNYQIKKRKKIIFN